MVVSRLALHARRVPRVPTPGDELTLVPLGPHLRVVERPEASVPGKPVNKWELLRELSKAQAAFGVSERDLTVLQGLLSFSSAYDHEGYHIVPSSRIL